LKLANYIDGGAVKAGVVLDSKIYSISDQTGKGSFPNVDRILSTDSLYFVKSKLAEISNGTGSPINSVKLASPVLSPEKIYCAAINYVSHSKEQSQKPPSEPYFFTKFRNALIGPEDVILLPRISKQVDWEVELAVIIGKRGKDIPKDRAIDYVAGYTISNDISFRDYQKLGQQNYLGINWVRGKGLDTALPMGPWLVTKDELSDPYSSEISLSVNGVERQKSKISDMVFKIDSLIEYISADVTLVPGDVISTGTPLGVAAFTGVPFLKDGDVVEAKIEGIGVLKNYVKAQ
jgi:2-keto-4-pentenoate hydratase/2-oxohepta-3-ene-1,7-dioic acid hydratase in catechol pathway